MTHQRTSWFRIPVRRYDISWLEVALIAMAAVCIAIAVWEAVR